MASRPFATCTIGVDGHDKSTTSIMRPSTVSRNDVRASSRRRVRIMLPPVWVRGCRIGPPWVATHLEHLEKSGKVCSCMHEIWPIGSQENH